MEWGTLYVSVDIVKIVTVTEEGEVTQKSIIID